MDRIANLLGMQNGPAVLATDPKLAASATPKPRSRARLGSGSLASQLEAARRELAQRDHQLQEQKACRVQAERRIQTVLAEKQRLLEVLLLMRPSDSEQRTHERVLQAIEMERERIGQDLHDSLGQQLSAIKFLCTALAQKAARNEPILYRDIDFVEKRVNAAISQTRVLAKGICLLELKEKGLVAALRGLASELEALQIKCRFQCTGSFNLPGQEASRELFQIAQEATANAIRHGRAQQILIELGSDDRNRFFLRISNDGAPFATDSTTSEGMGLKLMECRARKIGAKLAVGNDLNGSVSVKCIFPIST